MAHTKRNNKHSKEPTVFRGEALDTSFLVLHLPFSTPSRFAPTPYLSRLAPTLSITALGKFGHLGLWFKFMYHKKTKNANFDY